LFRGINLGTDKFAMTLLTSVQCTKQIVSRMRINDFNDVNEK